MYNKWPKENPNGNKYMQNFTLFENFTDSCLKNDPFCLISQIRASTVIDWHLNPTKLSSSAYKLNPISLTYLTTRIYIR